MKKLLFILAVLFAVSACDETPKKPKPPRDGYYDLGDDSLNFVRCKNINGIRVMETPYVNKKIEGLVKEYYPDGKTLKNTAEHKAGKYHGLFTRFYETGEKYSETPYTEGKEQGTRYNYKKDGTVTMKVTYENGIPVPPLLEYDAKGNEIPQPKIVFKTNGGLLKMTLDPKSFLVAQFYIVEKDKLTKISTEKGEGVMQSYQRGMTVRAVYRSKHGNEGAVDAKY